MNTSDEAVVSSAIDSTPLPIQVGEKGMPCAPPTASNLIAWIAAAGGQPWFPSQYAAATGADRDALDDPLSQLRMAGLIRIASWVRGVGQGYVLTPEGEQAAAAGIPLPGKEPPSGEAIAADASTGGPFEAQTASVVPVILIANALWFVASSVVALRAGVGVWQFLAAGDATIAHRFGSVSGADLLRGEWWRLLTACFVHGGAIHLAANLFSLAVVGPLAEVQWGRRRFAVIYLFSCLGGNCLAMAVDPQHAVIGASGCICGVLAAVGLWFWINRKELAPDDAIDVARRWSVAVLATVALSVLPGISWEAHLGGALAGAVAALVLTAVGQDASRRRRLAIVLLFVLPLAMTTALAGVSSIALPWQPIRARLAAEAAQRATVAAARAYDENVVPRLLLLLGKEPVRPTERAAVTQLLRPASRRNAAIVAETREQLQSMKATADQIVELLSSPPVGMDAIDERRTRARAFAEARSLSFAMLLDLLTHESLPTESQWAAWGDVKRRAETLDEQLRMR